LISLAVVIFQTYINFLSLMLGKGALLFLHGSGGDGREISTYLASLPLLNFQARTFRQILDDLDIDLYTPTAKERPYSPIGGDYMTVWFDRSPRFMIEGLNSPEDTSGIDESLGFLKSYVEKLDHQKHYDYYVLGGFSMGGGLSLHAYRYPIHPKLQAIFCISSFAVSESAIFKQEISNQKHIPLNMMHGNRFNLRVLKSSYYRLFHFFALGESDDLIKCEWGRTTAADLHIREIDVTFSTYKDVQHELVPEEVCIK
jgi:predicted esterase